MPPNTLKEMPTPPPPLDGELRFDEATRNERADDFGHIVHKMPDPREAGYRDAVAVGKGPPRLARCDGERHDMHLAEADLATQQFRLELRDATAETFAPGHAEAYRALREGEVASRRLGRLSRPQDKVRAEDVSLEGGGGEPELRHMDHGRGLVGWPTTSP